MSDDGREDTVKYMSAQYRRVLTRAQSVRGWLKASDGVIEKAVNAEAVTPPLSTAFGVVAAICGFGVIVCLMFASQPEASWPTIGWYFLGGLGGILGAMLFGRPAIREMAWLRREKRKELEGVRRLDPIFQRAQLMLQAIDQFRFYCDRYEAWFKAVDEGLQEPDEAAADRYHDFLVRTSTGLDRAISNFDQAVALEARRQQYAQEHPALVAASEGAALTELMSLLDQPVELPSETVGLLEPARALEHEEALSELVDADGAQLSAEIADLANR